MIGFVDNFGNPGVLQEVSESADAFVSGALVIASGCKHCATGEEPAKHDRLVFFVLGIAHKTVVGTEDRNVSAVGDQVWLYLADRSSIVD